MTKLVVILGFTLSFAAGVVIGSRGLGDRAPADTTDHGTTTAPVDGHGRDGGERGGGGDRKRDPGGWLTRELGLTPDQRAQLDRIWSAVASRGRDEQEQRRREYRRDRDEAIADLVPAARMGEYDRVMDVYAERLAGLERESREAYDAAVEQTKQILTGAQRAEYEELLKRHRWGPGAARDRHAGGGRRAETRATSRPATGDSPSPSHEPSKGAPR